MPPTAYEREIDPDVLPLMTKQAPSTVADAMSYSPADDSGTVSANFTAPIMSEDESQHGAALLVRVSQVNGCF